VHFLTSCVWWKVYTLSKRNCSAFYLSLFCCYLSFNLVFIFVCLFLVLLPVVDWIECLMHARQELYHWAISLIVTFLSPDCCYY
jgi:hypothetical protein